MVESSGVRIEAGSGRTTLDVRTPQFAQDATPPLLDEGNTDSSALDDSRETARVGSAPDTKGDGVALELDNADFACGVNLATEAAVALSFSDML